MKNKTKYLKMPDFEKFWEEKVNECKKKPFGLKLKKIKQPLKDMQVFRISYKALDGEDIIAYKILPSRKTAKKIPFLVHIHGYTGSKGFPYEYARWVAMGLGVVAIDARGQGGETRNTHIYRSGVAGQHMTLGVFDKDDSYLGKLYLDTIRAVLLTKSFKEADPNKIIVEGGSQGGGATVAVSGILGKEVFAAMADVPSYSEIPMRIKAKTGSFKQINELLKKYPGKRKLVLENMSYFDNVNLAPRITCPILCSVGLADNVCPPKNFYPAYAQIRSNKEIRKYPGAGHEGGSRRHENVKVNWLSKILSKKG